jgi:hypothetical protein
MRQWLQGETPDIGWFDSWLDGVRGRAAEGRFFRRVRVVSVPMTDNARYSLWLSQFNNQAGEDIRYLDREDADRLELPDFDYWLFDSRRVAKMYFDEDDDRFIGFEIIEDPAVVVELNYQRDAAWHHATTRDDFAEKHLT